MISLYVNYAAGRRLELVTPVTALSRPVSVTIMSDCKSCVLFLCKKKSVADEGPVLSTEVWLVLIIYALQPPPPPHFKEIGGPYCVCIVRYFVCVFLRGLKQFLGKDIKNLIYKYFHIYVLSFTPYKTI